MKIGLNATCFNDRPSGAKQRFIGLYSQLFNLMRDSEFIVIQPSDCIMNQWFDSPNVKFVSTPIPSEGRLKKFFQGSIFWDQTLKNENLDLFECFNLPSVRHSSAFTIQTIHDVRSLRENSSIIEKMIGKYVHKTAIAKTNKIITVSQTMRDEILNYFPSANIEFLYNGIDLDNFVLPRSLDLDITKKKFSLPSNFLLSVGHFEHRKNYSNLIHAIKSLKEAGQDYFLVIVGNDNGNKNKIAEQINSLNLHKNIVLLSNLSDTEVKCIYALSTAFIFPSIYEGFGIPILESMAFNKPVILSDINVFKEITEDQGVYFDPKDIWSIGEKIRKVTEDPNLSSRLIEYGRKRVKEFDFKNLAPKLLDIYLSQ